MRSIAELGGRARKQRTTRRGVALHPPDRYHLATHQTTPTAKMIRPLSTATTLLLLSDVAAFGPPGHSASSRARTRYAGGAAQQRTTNALNSARPPKFLSTSSQPPLSPWSVRTSPTALNSVAVDMVNNFFLTQPYTAAALTCGVKASAADYVAQRRHLSKRDGSPDEIEIDEEGTEQEVFEAPRNLAFLLYGAIYQGMGQELIYNHLYSAWFGSGTGPAIVAAKVAFDLLIQTTLLTLPVAYLTKAAIFRYSFAEGLRRYWEDITTHGLLLKYFALWGPVQCLTFSVVPEQFRIGFVAAVSFFWLIILSSISAKPRQADLNTNEASPSESTKPLVKFEGMDDDDISAAIDGDDECLLADGYTCSIDG